MHIILQTLDDQEVAVKDAYVAVASATDAASLRDSKKKQGKRSWE